jgi:tRNA1Val (adenine37-N6)-methyltransferase
MSIPPSKPFRFKQFDVHQSRSAMRVGTDAVLLGAWSYMHETTHILDVGTGTGVIALICAQRQPMAIVEAVELDEGSSEDAQTNFQASPWKERLKLFHGDYLKVAGGRTFDLIISNPPYFSQSLRGTNPMRNAARHDDSLPAEAFMQQSRRLLKTEGRIALIFPTTQMERWLTAGDMNGFKPLRICHVYTLAYKVASRVMVEFSREVSTEPAMESLLIEKSPGEFSEVYKQLTRDFYTKW